MQIGLIIVGDEILSGRRADKHLPKVVELLGRRGLVLSWCRIVADEPGLLEATFRDTFSGEDLVFSTGGIGGTPDDLTREAAARALDSPTEHHPEGVEILEAFVKARNRELKPEHYRMVEFPKGSELVPNPINSIPGFSIRNHYFVPGFSEMAWPMIEWVLDNRYPQLRNDQYLEQAVTVYGQYESTMIPVMEYLLARYPGIKVFSLPMIGDDQPRIELGVKGLAQDVKAAMAELKTRLTELNARWEVTSQ